VKLFSRRNDPIPDRYHYDITERVRNRLVATLKKCVEASGRRDFMGVLGDVENLLHVNVGALAKPPNRLIPQSEAIFYHFYECSDEEVIDFLILCFQTRGYCGGPPTVDAINEVLREENIGYELTDFQEIPTQHGHRIVTPTAIKKEEELLHRETVKPCLRALSDKRFATALEELTKAFDEYRKGDYGDAVTDAGASVETVLKTICKHKKWAYSSNDSCSRLLEICCANGLFPPFYQSVLAGTATIRNKIGDAHGKGPTPAFTATKELADHMIYTAANNLSLLVTLAKL
jgi:hypothetical protein